MIRHKPVGVVLSKNKMLPRRWGDSEVRMESCVEIPESRPLLATNIPRCGEFYSWWGHPKRRKCRVADVAKPMTVPMEPWIGGRAD